jgi:DNA-binding HxlR family transcriptional regulator
MSAKVLLPLGTAALGPVQTGHTTVPHKVEYTATDMARELYDCLLGLTGWAERHQGAVAEARHAYDQATAVPK